MTDLAQLESQILADIAAAGDEAALEAVRVAALGKKGSISALLSTLGKMSPDERKTEGAKINLAKDAVTQALTARRDILKSAALDARLKSETIDVTLPLREAPAEAGRIHPLSQVMDELTAIFGYMGFAVAGRPSGAGDARYLLLQSEARRLAHAVAHAYVTGAGPHHADPGAADPRDLSRPHLPHRLRRDAYAAVPPGRGPRHRQGLASRPPQMDPARVLQGVLRGRPHQHAVPAVVLSVHRAVARSRHPVPPRQGRNPLRRGRGLAGDSRLRHGASECAARLRHRSRRLSGFCLGHGHRPHRDAEIRHVRPAPAVRERRALAQSLRLQATRRPYPGGRIEFVSFVETAVEARAPTLALPRKREREQTDFGTGIFYRTVSASGAPEDAGSLSIGRSAPPLPLAGEGWGGGSKASEVAMDEPKKPTWKVPS